jgi:hypothetical protein
MLLEDDGSINREVEGASPRKEFETILAQIGWYREMVDHLRHSYGGSLI